MILGVGFKVRTLLGSVSAKTAATFWQIWVGGQKGEDALHLNQMPSLSKDTASCRKIYLAFPLESFWVEMTIVLVGRGGLGSTAAFERYRSSSCQDKAGERRAEKQDGSEAVHSHITVTVEGL